MKTREMILKEVLTAEKDSYFNMADIYRREGKETTAVDYETRAFELMNVISLMESDEYLLDVHEIFFKD